MYRYDDAIDNTEDTIDSREVIRRINDLTNMVDTWTCSNCNQEITYNVKDDQSEGHDDDCIYSEDGEDYGDDLDESGLDYDEREELQNLMELDSQGESISGWRDGVTLINDKYFIEYTKDLVEDIHGIDVTVWPFSSIDWEDAAGELQSDYTSIDFGDSTYWIKES